MEPEIIKVKADVEELKKALDEIDKKFDETAKKAGKVGDSTEKSSKKASKEIGDVNKELKNQDTQLSKNTKTANKFGSTITKMGALIAGAFAVEKLIQFTVELGKMAVEIEQVDQKARIVFGDSLPLVTRESEKAANAIGLTAREFRSAAAGVADILVPLGFARRQSAELAVETTKLAGAISNWSGGQYSAAESSEILQKALVGETEQLKSVGIVVDQSSKQFNERLKVLQKDQNLTLQQAKALDILDQVTRQSADAQTAYADGSDNMAVKLAEANARAREAKETLAEMITPAMVSLTNSYADAVESISVVSSSNLSGLEKLGLLLGSIAGPQGQQALQMAQLRIEGFNRALDNINSNGAADEIAKINDELRTALGMNEETEVVGEGIVEGYQRQISELDALIKKETDRGALNGLIAEKTALEGQLSDALGKTKEEVEKQIKAITDLDEAWNNREYGNQEAGPSVDDIYEDEVARQIEANEAKAENSRAYADYEIALQQEVADAQLTAVNNFFEAFKMLAGDNAEAQKALGIFQATVNAYVAITQALANAPNPIVGAVLATSIGAMAFAQVAKIASQEVPSFYNGTDFVRLNGNKAGRDTVPAMLNEGEGVVTTEANKRWDGAVKSMNAGRFDQYVTARHVKPALDRLKKEQEKEKAVLLSAAIKGTVNARLDDSKIVRELKRSRHVNEEMAYLIARSQSRKNPYRR